MTLLTTFILLLNYLHQKSCQLMSFKELCKQLSSNINKLAHVCVFLMKWTFWVWNGSRKGYIAMLENIYLWILMECVVCQCVYLMKWTFWVWSGSWKRVYRNDEVYWVSMCI